MSSPPWTDAPPDFPPWYPEAVSESDFGAAALERPRLPAAVRALEAPPPLPITWAIEDLWTTADIGLIVGDGGAFKSSAALHIGGAIAGGYLVFEKFRAVRRPVLIVSAEDSQDVILMRLEAFCVGQGWNRERVLGSMHIIAGCEPSLASRQWQSHILNECARLDVGFVIFDPLAELLDGDENSNTDVRPIIKFSRLVAQQTGAAVAIVHHAGKAGPEKRQLDRIRGASALASAARVILFFEFRDDGVYVENLKLSRAERLKPFTIFRRIEHAPESRAQWTSARLTYEDTGRTESTRADEFVLAQLRIVHPSRLGSRALRDRARSVNGGVRNEELDHSLHVLLARGLVDWVAGPRASKLWGLTASGSQSYGPGARSGTVVNMPELALGPPYSDCAHRAPSVPGRSGHTGDGGAPLTVRAPLGGPAQSAASPVVPAQSASGLLDLDDTQAEIDERLGLQGDGQ